MRSTARQALIATRALPDTKTRFAALAASRGLTESALLGLLIDTVLAQNPMIETPPEMGGATERISLRLRPGDRELVARRAAARNMKMASYLVMLIRAHLRENPPMPLGELNALKAAVGSVSAVGRNLNQLVRLAHAGGVAPEDLPPVLIETQVRVDCVRKELASVVRVHLKSWEASDA